MREQTFFELIFRENGVSPDPEKISAIVKCTPTSLGEVWSFLGMTVCDEIYPTLHHDQWAT